MTWTQLAILIFFLIVLFLWYKLDKKVGQRKIDKETKERKKRKDDFVKDLHETKEKK